MFNMKAEANPLVENCFKQEKIRIREEKATGLATDNRGIGVVEIVLILVEIYTMIRCVYNVYIDSFIKEICTLYTVGWNGVYIVDGLLS